MIQTPNLLSKSYSEFLQVLRTKDEKSRYALNAQRSIEVRRQMFVKKNVCPNCWILKSRGCICSQRPQNVRITTKIYLYMHHKEFGRSTNTGIDLAQACSNIRILVNTLPESEETIRRIIFLSDIGSNSTNNSDCNKKPESLLNPNTFVLFPSANSISVNAFLERRKSLKLRNTSQNLKEGEREEDNVSDPLNVIILDGTWNQARCLDRRLPPELPRVKLSSSGLSRSHLRKQIGEGKVTTAEATLLLLQELGEDQEEIAKLWKCLQLRIEAVDRITGRHDKTKLNENEEDIGDRK